MLPTSTAAAIASAEALSSVLAVARFCALARLDAARATDDAAHETLAALAARYDRLAIADHTTTVAPRAGR